MKSYTVKILSLPLQDFFHLPIDSHICVCVCLLLDFLHANTNKCKLIYILFSLHALMMATDCLTHVFNIIISQMSHHVSKYRECLQSFFFFCSTVIKLSTILSQLACTRDYFKCFKCYVMAYTKSTLGKHIFISSPLQMKKSRFMNLALISLSRSKAGI